MNETIEMILMGWLAGLTIFLGGMLSRYEPFPEGLAKREILHGLVGLGGGLLVAAVALVLVPTGLTTLSLPPLVGSFVLGSLVFCIIDRKLALAGGPLSQTLAMLMDFLPEAAALGAVFAQQHRLGVLLAVLIGAQNLPEGFNSYREMTAAGNRPRKALWIMLILSFSGIFAVLLGRFVLQPYPALVAAVMSFAAGGILYLVFQDIAPMTKMRRHWGPPLGASLGFAVGMIAERLVG